MSTLVTGAAGFIGSSLVLRLLSRGDRVIGIDNHNDYYDPVIKEARIARYICHPNYTHLRADLADRVALEAVFRKYSPKYVVNLAAQAGVRYSIQNPMAFINSNIVGFANVLECCRYADIKHLVYASSSSVYGGNKALPFSVHQNTNHPLSVYAASKKSNELMSHVYSHLYGLPSTGLRFFTVYGPWGRPDMALFKFTKAIFSDEAIQVYNFGKHRRDFTYIDDVVDALVRVIDTPAKPCLSWEGEQPDPSSSLAPWRVYNVGGNLSTDLSQFITALETAIGKKARIEYLPLQPGDVLDTYADVSNLAETFDCKPEISVDYGVTSFVKWYRDYYAV